MTDRFVKYITCKLKQTTLTLTVTQYLQDEFDVSHLSCTLMTKGEENNAFIMIIDVQGMFYELCWPKLFSNALLYGSLNAAFGQLVTAPITGEVSMRRKIDVTARPFGYQRHLNNSHRAIGAH